MELASGIFSRYNRAAFRGPLRLNSVETPPKGTRGRDIQAGGRLAAVGAGEICPIGTEAPAGSAVNWAVKALGG